MDQFDGPSSTRFLKTKSLYKKSSYCCSMFWSLILGYHVSSSPAALRRESSSCSFTPVNLPCRALNSFSIANNSKNQDIKLSKTNKVILIGRRCECEQIISELENIISKQEKKFPGISHCIFR